MAKNNGNYTFKFEHQDDPDYPSSLEILHKITPRNPHVKNLLEKEVTTNEKLVFLQTVIDLVRYVLTAAPNNGVSAYQEMLGAEVEINQFKSLLFDEKIGLLEGIRQYNKENPQATEFQDKSNEASVEKELWDQPNEDLSKNYIQQNLHMNLKDGKHEDPAFLERVFKDNVFQLTTEEYLLLRKSIYLSNAGIYFYQRGWDPNISQSPQRIAKLVVDNIVWRWVYKPEKTKWEDVIESAKCGSLFDYGLDKMGNPMIYMVVGREDLSRKLDDRATLLRFRHLCLCFEHIMNRLYDGSSQNYLGQEKSEFLGSAPFQITWVVDIRDASLSIDLVKKIKFIFDLLGFYYPERSEIVFVMNIPWMAKMLWAVISQFLTQRQRNQYQFLSDPFLTKLTQNIEPKYVGGDLAISGVGANTESDYTFDLGSRIKACNKRPVITKWVDE